MKSGKTPGPDDITTEIISGLVEWGIDQITRLLNTVYDTGYISPDLWKSIFIAITNKAGAFVFAENSLIERSFE